MQQAGSVALLNLLHWEYSLMRLLPSLICKLIGHKLVYWRMGHRDICVRCGWVDWND